MNTRFIDLINGTQFRKVAAFGLAAVIGFSSTISMSAQGAPANTVNNAKYRQAQLQARQAAHQTRHKGCPDLSREDLVLVMPNAGADKDEMNKALEDVNGTVIGSIGKGDCKVLIVKAEKGKAQAMETKLSKDSKNFKAVNVNHVEVADYVPTDPTVSTSWHLPKMHLYEAWDLVKTARAPWGYSNRIAILDSGCSWNGDTGVHNWGADVTGVHRDIADKLEDEMDGGFLGIGSKDVDELDDEIEHWGNYAHTLSMGVYDNHGHGTWVAATCAGAENGKNSVGIAPGNDIYPIKIADGPAGTKIKADDISLISGMVCAMESRARIVNISYSGMNDPDRHEVLHELFKNFYFKRNGIIFVSAGNDGVNLPNKDCNYINCVSAIKQVKDEDVAKGAPALQLVDRMATGGGWASNTGACVDFCAPGIDIQSTNTDGTPATVGGTSFSSPICAGLAALILRVNPKLSNSQVQNIMIHSCTGVRGGRDYRFGFGMPDAERAIREALRS